MYDVLALDELNVGQQVCRTVAGRKLLLVRTEQGIFALENRCPHAGFPLDGGRLKQDRIQCPVHKASFALADGMPIANPRLDAVVTFPVVLREGRVCVQLDEKLHP